MSFLKRKKKKENTVLEKLCNKIVDVINETFTKKYYFVEISQSKKGHIYLIVRKKRGRLISEKKTRPSQKDFWCIQERF